MEWIEPPWRNENEEGWPWVGDQFLAAIPYVSGLGKNGKYEYVVLKWSESNGLQRENGEYWEGDEEDIAFIAKIPSFIAKI